MPKAGGLVTNGDSVLGSSSRTESKRPHRWSLDGDEEPELFPGKKQAVEASASKVGSGIGMSNVNVLPWDASTGFNLESHQFMDRLFGSERVVGDDGASMNKQVDEGHFENYSSVGLSMSYGVEDIGSEVGCGGIRKIKVKEGEIGLETSVDEGLGMSMDQAYNCENNFTLLLGHPYDMGDVIRPSSANIRKDIEGALSMSLSYNKGDSKNISFGGYHHESVIDAPERPVGSYGLLYEQPSLQASETNNKKEVDAVNGSATTVNSSQIPKSRVDPSFKSKPETKPARKEAPNSFPSNVRSLMATGMLDGVPVRYVTVTREELRGVIKGSGYLCGCLSCNFSKALNAYEFERHANCKTKHPNNHIYFENGKTIYQIVQELRNTPESALFDAVQTVTGSAINQKAFRIWKESFQAATRELQRIYGKEELNL